MAKSNTAWGIEIGQYAIKAIQLEEVGDEVRVRDFAVIPHVQVLTDPELSSDGDAGAIAKATAVLEMSLSALATQKQLTGQKVVVNFNWITGRGFARFAKLPAVSPREIPNLVKYEVDQQIPFPVDEIEWDYHAFESADSPEIEVGLFAIQKEPLEEFLALVGEKLGVDPHAVTLGPIALYNAFAYDRGIPGKNEPFVLLDIGTSSTDLIVAHGTRCWMRTFPLGGHNFTAT
jgi:type IV pilus assembly protein PilM